MVFLLLTRLFRTFVVILCVELPLRFYYVSDGCYVGEFARINIVAYRALILLYHYAVGRPGTLI